MPWIFQPGGAAFPVSFAQYFGNCRTLCKTCVDSRGAAKSGRQRICRIEPQSLRMLDQWVTPRRRVWDTRLQNLQNLFR
jgi:hypothetical protein